MDLHFWTLFFQSPKSGRRSQGRSNTVRDNVLILRVLFENTVLRF